MLTLEIGGLALQIAAPASAMEPLAERWVRFAAPAQEAAVSVSAHIYTPRPDAALDSEQQGVLNQLAQLWVPGWLPSCPEEAGNNPYAKRLIQASLLITSCPAFAAALRVWLESGCASWQISIGSAGHATLIDARGSQIHVFLPDTSEIGLGDCLYLALARTLPLHGALMLHGCAVGADAEAYLFCGPSGTGKTTIAHLSQGKQVLSDEQVIVRVREGIWSAFGTPWVQFVDLRDDRVLDPRAAVPVRALVLPVQSDHSWCEPVDGRHGLALALGSCNLGSALRDRRLGTQALELCGGFASAVRNFRMGFALDSTFWSVLQAAADSSHD
jgi:hypothetical protein